MVKEIKPIDFMEFVSITDNETDSREILRLYERRKRRQIEAKYTALIDKEYDELEVVKRYNEIVNTFNASLSELADEYCTLDDSPIVRNNNVSEYNFKLRSGLRNDIVDKYRGDKYKEIGEMLDLLEEVNAMISISTDKDYQLDVLDRYGITKKGKLNI